MIGARTFTNKTRTEDEVATADSKKLMGEIKAHISTVAKQLTE